MHRKRIAREKKRRVGSRLNELILSAVKAAAYVAMHRTIWRACVTIRGIKNGLHQVKDVVMQEDASRIRMGNAPQNLSALRNKSINLLRSHKGASIGPAIRRTANDITGMKKMII